MALYFLNHVSTEFKQKYIAGFIPLSGNFAGQGLFPVVYVQGLTVENFGFDPTTIAAHRGWPGNYFSGPQPVVFTGPNNLTFLETDARNYSVTDADLDAFFTDVRTRAPLFFFFFWWVCWALTCILVKQHLWSSKLAQLCWFSWTTHPSWSIHLRDLGPEPLHPLWCENGELQ